jgi:hypothetical protein
MQKILPKEGLSAFLRVVFGLLICGLGLFLLYIDLEGMLNKTQVPFLKSGYVDYLESPILFWVFGVFWMLMASFITFVGFCIAFLGKSR